MSKLEETNGLIDLLTEYKENGFNVDDKVFLADIAKSLAMIADKLCEEQQGEQE